MQEKSKEVFLENIRENAGIIHKVTAIYTDTKEDREDLYQEILYQSWKSYSSFRQDSKFSTWLYRISLNTALVFRRKDTGQAHFQLNESISNHLDNSYEYSQPTHELIAAIKTLSKVDRMIITLYLEGYTYQEIANMAGISKDNTGVKIFRIKNILSQILK
jgi:RNA polymerase sigma factor (sigma-70 family)